MKKVTHFTFAVGVLFSLTFMACGEKFTPLTQEQINAQVDSLYNAQKDAKLAELQAACQSGLEAQVNAAVEAKKAASAETAAK